MTRDEAKQLLENIEFVKAFASGEIVQRNFKDSEFIKGWASFENMGFLANPSEYRIKKENKKAPMTYEDFQYMPIVLVKKPLDAPYPFLVIAFEPDGFVLGAGGICYFSYDDARRNNWSWSIDRVNWHKFEKEIES